MTDATFTGFPRQTFDFLAGLAKTNSKTWFETHRPDYEAHVVDPAMAFIAAMAAPLAQIDPSYQAVPKLNGSYRRLNRDVRFSKDKTPYSPRIHLVFWTGDHPNRSPAIHLVLHADGLGYGAGAWAWSPETLARFRKTLDDEGARDSLRAAIAAAEGVGARLTEPALKRVPKGVDPGHPAADLMRHKGLVVRTANRVPLPDTIDSPAFVETCKTIAHGLHPVAKWLNDRLI